MSASANIDGEDVRMRAFLKWILLYLFVFANALFVGCSAQNAQIRIQGKALVPQNQRLSLPPVNAAIGSLKGVPVAIPSGFIFFPVQYEGEDPWSSKRKKSPPTLSTSILTISLRARLPDLEPVTPQNENEWRDFLKHPRDDSDWITIQVEARRFDVSGTEWVQRFVDRVRANVDIGHLIGWRYQKLEEKRYGLTTEVLVGGKDREKHWISDRDLLYDTETWQTLIECDAYLTRPNLTCKQYFPLPEVNADVRIQYHVNRLKDWKSMQEKLTALIAQFVVKRNAADSK